MAKLTTKQTTFADFPEFVAATAKLAELGAACSQLEAELDAARLERADAGGKPSRLEDEARAFLSGDGGTAVAAPTIEAVGEMVKRLRLLREAMRLQRRAVDELRAKLSREIAQSSRAEYSAILARMATALVTLSEAAEDEAQFRDRFQREGIAFTSVVPPAPLPWARLSVYASRANQWFDEVTRDYGIKCSAERQTSPGGPSV